MPTPFDDFVARLEMVEKPDPLVGLSVQVPLSVARALDDVVYQVRMKGGRIAKQRIVADALVTYLGLSKPATQPTPENPES